MLPVGRKEHILKVGRGAVPSECLEVLKQEMLGSTFGGRVADPVGR